MKILIMGLPGAGKTVLATNLCHLLRESNKTVAWLNADIVRQEYDDWDFSYDGRIRQSHRMAELAKRSVADFVICDFVAPLPEMRNNFDADFTIWMDTIESGRFDDTNKLFVKPDVYDMRVTEYLSDFNLIVEKLLNT